MKPQCTTAAECLRELARVMEQFKIDNPIIALHSKCVKEASGWLPTEVPGFNRPSDWQFAIAEVEGKPVFIGDELYTIAGGIRFIAGEIVDDFLCQEGYSSRGYGISVPLIGGASWNPPKPKTVVVELPYEVAEFAAKSYPTDTIPSIGRACKTALEKLK